MNPPADLAQRERFIRELDHNFSVVASAGSGKTRAITERILAIAESAHALQWLPKLVVVTYTNRAADEMQQRTREALLRAKVSLDVLSAFGRAFFGTIHSFCLRLLSDHGHHLGLPGNLQLLQDEEPLWRDFVQQHSSLGESLNADQKRDLLRLVPAQRLLELGRVILPDLGATSCSDFPRLAFEPVYSCAGKGAAARTIAASQEALRNWERQWLENDGFLTLPSSHSKAAEFMAAWEACIQPIRGWMRGAALAIGLEIARAYRCYRLAHGFVTYDDQIALALALLCNAQSGRALRARGCRVILDEAQDTDPSQFGVLLELTRPEEAQGDWLKSGDHPPQPGHFCMVGDFQQSIFSQRADISHYRRVHQALLASGFASELNFSVTFRLDAEIVDFVNCTFKHVLQETDGQVPFQPLCARPAALGGQVLRVQIPGPENPVEGGVAEQMQIEAEELARWLEEVGLERLRAEDWSEVAIICPRTRWFTPLRDALRKQGFSVQIQSEREIKGDSAAFAWLTALVVILTEPDNSYEVVGVLREIYGISDDALAQFSQGDGTKFCLAVDAPGEIGRILRSLFELHLRIASMPLFSAVQEIIASTALRDRLASLPPGDHPDSSAQIETLLTRAAVEESTGATLREFADLLRKDFRSTRETRGSARGAIQLITGHKAKGSEWQAVIIPALGREVRSGNNKYPQVVRDPRDQSILLAMDSDDVVGDLKELVKTRERQEFERLLYVALTRAKHTLVLVDDLALFAGQKGVAKTAQASVLQCARGAQNAEVLAGLCSEPASCSDTGAQHRTAAERAAAETVAKPLPAFTQNEHNAAHRRAAVFIKRNPSALAHEADSEVPGVTHSTGSSDSPVYGLWWHGFAEEIIWSTPEARWDAIFERELASSPDAERSRDEWSRLRAQLGPDMPWYSALCERHLIVKAEMPFLWKMSETECIEGIMDLVVFDPSAAQWLIVDWKTNPITTVELPRLKQHYLPQLAAYWRALSDMTGQPVRAALYSTTCATWLPYTSEDLDSSWRQIAGDPHAISKALEEDRLR